jgi:hypothetical protein
MLIVMKPLRMQLLWLYRTLIVAPQLQAGLRLPLRMELLWLYRTLVVASQLQAGLLLQLRWCLFTARAHGAH